MDMQNLLNKLNGLLAEETSNPEPEQLSLDLYQNVDMAGEPCIKCKKGHYTETSIYDDWDGVQHCSNCNHQIKRHLTTDELNELKKSVSESDEAGPVKQCVSCGEKAHVDHTTGMCVDCLTKAEEEQGISESPMGSRATADTKMKAKKCAFCGGNIVGRGKTTEKGDTICKDCDDYYAFDGPGGEEPDELDEASATKNALYGQIKKTSTPRTFKPEISDEPIDTDQFDFEDENVSCWGCGQDWKENWSAEELGPGEGYEEYGLDADDKICPDCAEELTGGELNEAAMCEDCGEQPCVCETDQLDEVTALGDRNPGRVEPDDPSLRDDRHLKTVVIPTSKCLELVAKDFEGDEGHAWYEFEKIMQREVPGWKTADWEWDVQVNDSGITVFTQEKEYSGDDEYSLEEAAMCEDCGSAPCVCETEQLEEAKVKNYYAVATAAIKKKYDLGPGKVDLTDAQTAEAHKLAKKLKKDDQKLKESEQDGSAELDQLKKMMECWGPMAAPQASGMNVTTNVDSKTGNKTVTVTADGEGAEDLMQILAMAGIAITPAPVAATPVGEQVANEPAPQTLDAQTQLVDMAGGPNAPHAQYNPDRARDNSMAIVDEAVDRLASKLRAEFVRESQRSKSEKIKSVIDYDDDGHPVLRNKGLKKISKSKKSDPYTDPDGYPKSTPYGWKPASKRSEEDDWLH